jgi:hypothetical protein
MGKSPLARGLLSLLRDARAAIVAILVVALISGGVVARDHVRFRAWIGVLVIAVFLLAVFAIDSMRTRQRGALDHADSELIRLRGDLERAHAEAAAAAATPEPNAAAQELIRLIEALRSTILRRVEPYAATGGMDGTVDEISRFRYLERRVTDLIKPLPADLARLLQTFTPERGCESVDALLSGLDQMEAEITNWGLTNEHRGARASQGPGG